MTAYAWVAGCVPMGTRTWAWSGKGLSTNMHRYKASRAAWRACTVIPSSDRTEVTRAQVVQTARLARLDIGEDEISQVSQEFQNIIQLFDKLSDVNVDGVEPMARPHDSENVIREDEPVRFDGGDDILQQAPLVERDYVRVPRIGVPVPSDKRLSSLVLWKLKLPCLDVFESLKLKTDPPKPTDPSASRPASNKLYHTTSVR